MDPVLLQFPKKAARYWLLGKTFHKYGKKQKKKNLTLNSWRSCVCLGMKQLNSIEFPFEYVNLPSFGKVFYPFIPVALKTVDHGWVDFRFIVDTGADLTTLPFFMAKKLGINLAKSKTSKAEGIGGYVIKTWETKIHIRLKTLEISIRCSIVEDEQTPFLLGRIDLLPETFSWLFDSRNKKIIFNLEE